jgi:hypothetical protein
MSNQDLESQLQHVFEELCSISARDKSLVFQAINLTQEIDKEARVIKAAYESNLKELLDYADNELLKLYSKL